EFLGEAPLFAQYLCFPQRDRRLVRRDGEEKPLLLIRKVHPLRTCDDDAEFAVETQRHSRDREVFVSNSATHDRRRRVWVVAAPVPKIRADIHGLRSRQSRTTHHYDT